MDYIIIKGSVKSGKYTTISEICKRLQPDSIKKLHITSAGHGVIEPYSKLVDISSGNYIISINGRSILVVAGSPTEQRINITTIVKAALKIGANPQLAVISMRGRERLNNFSTANEVSAFGRCLHEIKIARIPAINYKLGEEWNRRITHLLNIIKLNL